MGQSNYLCLKGPLGVKNDYYSSKGLLGLKMTLIFEPSLANLLGLKMTNFGLKSVTKAQKGSNFLSQLKILTRLTESFNIYETELTKV